MERAGDDFLIETSHGEFRAGALVIATGGLSIPKIGATDFGYRLARQFGHKIIDTRPALVPLTFTTDIWASFAQLSGIALESLVETGKGRDKGSFLEDLLLTHRGLSGPAILQISSYWQSGTPITVDLLPNANAVEWLLEEKNTSRKQLANVLAQRFPSRLADVWCTVAGLSPQIAVNTVSDKALRRLGEMLNRWELVPSGSEGYRKAEVTRGGVDTRGLSSTTMMSETVKNLYFIGEVVDVTGWLGGYNFQWAWASAMAAARAAAAARE